MSSVPSLPSHRFLIPSSSSFFFFFSPPGSGEVRASPSAQAFVGLWQLGSGEEGFRAGAAMGYRHVSAGLGGRGVSQEGPQKNVRGGKNGGSPLVLLFCMVLV